MTSIAQRLAQEAVSKIIEDASGGEAYAPCFRDCLFDNRAVAEKRIAEAIEAAMDIMGSG